MRKITLIILISFLLLFPSFSADLKGYITEIDKYGNETTSITVVEALAAGFNVADIVDVSVGDWNATIPIGTSYSDVDSSRPLMLFKGEYVTLAINYGDFATTTGEGIGSAVEISLNEKEGYKEEYLVRQLVRSNERADYTFDSEFANFRPINAGGIKSGILYRSCSPVIGDSRSVYADNLSSLVGIKSIINLADSEDETDFSSSPYYSSVNDEGNVIYLSMGVDFFAPEFQEKLKQALIFLTHTNGPVLIHCNEGKDRAGMVSALLEALAGATIDEIVEDYMKSYENYYGTEKGSEQYEIISNIIKNLFISMNGRPFPWNSIGSVAENYVLNTLGLSPSDLASLREFLTN